MGSEIAETLAKTHRNVIAEKSLWLFKVNWIFVQICNSSWNVHLQLYVKYETTINNGRQKKNQFQRNEKQFSQPVNL